MAQSAATHIRRRILGSRQDPTNEMPLSNYQQRMILRVDRRTIDKVHKQIDRIMKYCQMPKMNLKNSPPYMLDILPDLHQTLRDIISHYEDRLHILNDIEYFRIFLDNLNELCTRLIDCFKRAGQLMYDEASNYRKDFVKLSLYFSHNLTELKSLFIQGIYEGERYRLTKQEATDFWKVHFNQRTIVPWKEFKEKLNLIHPIQTSNESRALQTTIDLTNNNYVSIFEFDVFTRLFHPWSSLLTNWKLLAVTHPGFMAFMTYDEVKAILTSYIDKPGSYVFRLSCTRLGQWAIGYVTAQNTILQTIPQTKPLIQSLIDGEREGYYKYPNGKYLPIDLSSAFTPTASDRIYVSEEQYAIYCDMDTSFELCKICSVNNKDSKIQPCGHLLCQNCLIAWQNQNSAKPPPLCPFCRGEIKGFEPVVVNPFDRSITQNKKETSPTTSDVNANLPTSPTFPVARPIDNENIASVLSDNLSSIPPPIPPRPANMKLNANRISMDSRTSILQRQYIPPPLHNNDILSLSQRSSATNQRPPSSISSNDSLSDSFTQPATTSGDIHLVSLPNNPLSSEPNSDHLQTIVDVRNHLTSETNFDLARIEAALTLTEGLSLSKQYEMAKLFLTQVKYEQEHSFNSNNIFINGSFVNEID